MKRPVAYLRKSRVFADKATVSPETQETQTAELAERNGDRDIIVLSDWNKSGKTGASTRPGYAELLRMIRAGEISTIYSYSLSRLSRSIKELSELVELCRQHEVAIRLVRDPDPDPSTAMGRMVTNILGVMAQFEADLAGERARDTVATRRARGDKMGRRFYGSAPGEDPELVVQALRDAGSLQGAARLLNARGVKTRGGKPWAFTAVKLVVARVNPDELPPQGEARVRSRGSFALSRVVMCYCGTFMTGSVTRGIVRYACHRAGASNDHGHPRSVAEHALIPQLALEARRWDSSAAVQAGSGSEDKKKALLERSERAREMFLAGYLDRAGLDTEMLEISSGLAELDSRGRLLRSGDVPWETEDRGLLNAHLRDLWSAVRVGPDMRVAAVDWRFPPEGDPATA